MKLHRERLREGIWFFLMAGPALLGFLFLVLGPMLYSFYLSFTSYNVVDPPRWVGAENYLYLIQDDPAFWPSVKVTLIYAGVQIPLSLMIALGIALLLNNQVKALGAFRTIFYLPSLLPATASVVIWIWIFHPNYGLLNELLSKFGIAGPAWLNSTTWALPALIIMTLWSFGGAMIVFLAGLQGVPRGLYEAASIDGANAWHRFRHVTLPILSPVIFFNLVMGVIGAMKVFDQAYVFGAAMDKVPGGPARATLFYVLHLFQTAFNYFHMGLASAMAWMLFAVIALLTWLNFRLGRKWVHH
ncbi:MAG TPA: sugar ABC transporter permease [Kiritimatiellia bacterium]|nr:sugar ABC transporter permease [Kiritimatiellia bacterium]HMP32775.1 sugar ABC transporter permease [Kiritimatiellia bacterium]